ncbi:MAG: hypothetical protein RL318_1910 [Fibrobacterota bacterium]|jgi:hypothetical protein
MPKAILIFLVAVLFGVRPVQALEADFDTYAQTRTLFGDTLRYRLVVDSGRTALQVTRTDSLAGTYITHALKTDSVAGGIYRVSACSRAFGLTAKPKHFNGVKVMLGVKRADGTVQNPQLPWPDTLDAYGWTRSSMVVTIPEKALKADLTLGLESMAGTVLFDSVHIERIGSAVMPPPRDGSLAIPRPFGTKLRGMMTRTPIDSASIAVFGSAWKGNVMRWQMNAGSGIDTALLHPDYETFLERELSRIDQALPHCRTHGVRLILEMHQMSSGLFHSRAAQSRLIQAWKRIAQRYRDQEVVVGYDLANEPPEGNWRESALLWNELADTLCRTIRSVDPETPIVVEPVLSDPERFAQLRPIGSDRGWDLPDIVYSFHFYRPYTLTHQGIGPTFPPLGATYPGTIDGIAYDSARLHESMRPAIEYQNRYRVPIYVGEFSCIRWAPQGSATKWLRDVTAILEHENWDWTYHAYREFHGWSIEHSEAMEDLRGEQETDRKALFLSLFQRNTASIPDGMSKSTRSPLPSPNLRIFPKNGKLVVEGIPDGATFEVRDLQGKVLAQVKGPSGSFAFPKGMAFGRVSGSNLSPWRPVPCTGLVITRGLP